MPVRRLRTAEADTGRGPIVVVSPHLDDGVLACGELLAGLARRRAVTVVTVFAGRAPPGPLTEWDRAAGFRGRCEAVAARRAEDRRALAALGARPRWLSFCDSQYGVRVRPEAVARRLAVLPGLGRRPGTVLFPLGLFHSDHACVRDAMLRLLRRGLPGARVLAYEDALYRRLPGQRDAALARLRRAALSPRRVRFAADAAAKRRKRRAVSCYGSQLRALATPGRLGHADAFAEEGYWLLRPTS